MILILILALGFIGALLFRIALNPAGTLLGLIQVAAFFGAVGAGLIFFYGGPAMGNLSYLAAAILMGIVWILLVVARSQPRY